jgi:nitroreductase
MKPLDTLTGSRRIKESDLRQLFLDARTHNGWLDEPVPDSVLREIYDIAKFGPTSMNTQPMRLLFLRTAAAKERLRPHLAPANVDKTMAAPVTAIVGHDLAFHEHLPRLFPHHPDAKGVFEGKVADRDDGLSQRQPSGSLPYHRCALARTGLRADVGVRQCRGGWRIFRRLTESSLIFCATSAMAIIRKSSLACHALISPPFARFFNCAMAARGPSRR